MGLSASARRAALILLGWICALDAQAGEIPFSSLVTIDGTLGGPGSVRVADIDGDGDLDLVTTASTDGDVSWWENDSGDASSWTEVSIDAAFLGAGDALAADIDGDGDVDVLAAALVDDDVSWWSNTAGDGSAWTETPIDSAFDRARSVFAADIDQDGDLDVLGAAQDDNTISWWENTAGDGSAWTEHPVETTFMGAASVVAADVDGDGDLDVLGAAITDGDIVWWENDGTLPDDGTPWPRNPVNEAFAGARSVSAADIDGDGDLDVLGAAGGDDEVAWWENTAGDGSLWTEHNVDPALDGGLASAIDLDRDGDLDILVTGSTDGTVGWFENDGSPADGVGGDGNSWTEHPIEGTLGTPRGVDAGDLDGDGDLDVTATTVTGGTLGWWTNEAIHRSAFFPGDQPIADPFDDARVLAAADLDCDGDHDVAGVSDSSALGAVWWENTAGDASAWTEHLILAGVDGAQLRAIDLDYDGDVDLVVTDFDGGEVLWFENTAGDASAWTKVTITTGFSTANGLGVGDIDGDGDLDVAATSLTGDELSWFENTAGDGSAWTEHSIDATLMSGQRLEVVDIDRDGAPDVVASSNDSVEGGIWWWRNSSGDGSTWTRLDIQENDILSALVVADLDGDGDPDVLSREFSAVLWWANDGSPADGVGGDGNSWTQANLATGMQFTSALAVADVDGDGDLDLLTGERNSEEVAWWDNDNGDASSFTRNTIDANFEDPTLIRTADLDLDGRIDFLTTQDTPDRAAWFANGGGQAALPTTDVAPLDNQNGQTVAVLEIEFAHRGKAGDSDAELAEVELLLEEAEGDPLSDAEANAIIESLRIYLDDGSGTFEEGSDTLMVSETTLALTAGVQTLTLADGDSDAQVAAGASKTYFVVTELTADAGSQTPAAFRITHLTEASSRTEDAAADIELLLEFETNTTATATGLDCFLLTLADNGFSGGSVDSSPLQSIGCTGSDFSPGELITLTAQLDPFVRVRAWQGTDDDASTDSVNSLTMPGSDTTVTVTFGHFDDLVISDMTINSSDLIQACNTLSTEMNVTISGENSPIFRAPVSVSFGDGLTVETDNGMIVELATPPAGCTP